MDTEAHVWTVPATRMKMKREHRVPLCGRALDILDAARTLDGGDGVLVFPSMLTSDCVCGGNRSNNSRQGRHLVVRILYFGSGNPWHHLAPALLSTRGFLRPTARWPGRDSIMPSGSGHSATSARTAGRPAGCRGRLLIQWLICYEHNMETGGPPQPVGVQ